MDILKNRLSRSLRNTFYLLKLLIIFSSKKCIRKISRDKLLLWPTPMCIYRLTYCFGASYIGCTKWSLSKLISENCPVWLSKAEYELIDSLILEHVVNSGHRSPQELTFNITDKVKWIDWSYHSSYFHKLLFLTISQTNT